MNFTDALKEAVERVGGAAAAMVIGADGMTVEQHTVEDVLSADDLSAESSQFIQDINTAVETLKLGTAQEFMIVSDRCGIILRRITGDYFLALVVKPGGNFGKGRFVLRTLAPKLEGEF